MCKKFIDISEYNTILSFAAVSQSNLSGVIIKASEGTTYLDHAMEVYYDSLHGNIPIGFYHFLKITSPPITQAQTFWNRIKDKKYEIMPALDVEDKDLGSSAESYSEQFKSEFKRLSGLDMIVYSNRCYIEEHFSDNFKKNNIWWVADYSANTTPHIDGCNIIAWQYTEDCRSYAFTCKDLDVSILSDTNKFFISDFVKQVNSYNQEQSNKNISVLQAELNIQGFRDKNGNKLIIDNTAGQLTLSACPMIKIGASGNITKWIQQLLGITADGIFGEQTRQAVIQFQENHSLDGDGIVGQNTWRKLLGL
jgi:GH25 family lysozyme M1 (1,4-beta-N-acetylmuramidase)